MLEQPDDAGRARGEREGWGLWGVETRAGNGQVDTSIYRSGEWKGIKNQTKARKGESARARIISALLPQLIGLQPRNEYQVSALCYREICALICRIWPDCFPVFGCHSAISRS